MATTTVFLIEREQHLYDHDADGKKAARPRIRRKGEHGLSLGTKKPHLERGSPEVGISLFSTHGNNGVLYEMLDDKLDLIYPITIDLLVADFSEFAR